MGTCALPRLCCDHEPWRAVDDNQIRTFPRAETLSFVLQPFALRRISRRMRRTLRIVRLPDFDQNGLMHLRVSQYPRAKLSGTFVPNASNKPFCLTFETTSEEKHYRHHERSLGRYHTCKDHGLAEQHDRIRASAAKSKWGP